MTVQPPKEEVQAVETISSDEGNKERSSHTRPGAKIAINLNHDEYATHDSSSLGFGISDTSQILILIS
jgi:hypothetical protein